MPSMEQHDCGYCAPGSGLGDSRVRFAAETPDEPEQQWRAGKVERQDGASLDDCPEENQLCSFEACSQDCGTCCSVLGCLLWDMGPLLVGSGNAVGRQSGNLSVGPCEQVTEGGSLGKRASPGWAGSQEG